MRHDAIRNIYPNAATIIDEQGVFDYDGNPVEINEVLVNQEVDRLMQEWTTKDYQRNRKREYPDIIDYIDGVVKGDQAQIQAYIDACLVVKAKYPKP